MGPSSRCCILLDFIAELCIPYDRRDGRDSLDHQQIFFRDVHCIIRLDHLDSGDVPHSEMTFPKLFITDPH